MSDPHEDNTDVSDGSVLGRSSQASQVGERASGQDVGPEVCSSAGPQRFESERGELQALLSLLRLGPDAVIDQLCEGQPRDFREECAAHVRDSAYFVEEGRVAARVIATLAGYACEAQTARLSLADLAEPLESIVEEATAAVLEEGALDTDAGEAPDPLLRRIGLVLGTDERLARTMMDTLNGFEFADRHVLFHCIVEGLSPEDYAKKFDDDARVVAMMLRSVSKLALDSPPS